MQPASRLLEKHGRLGEGKGTGGDVPETGRVGGWSWGMGWGGAPEAAREGAMWREVTRPAVNKGIRGTEDASLGAALGQPLT